MTEPPPPARGWSGRIIRVAGTARFRFDSLSQQRRFGVLSVLAILNAAVVVATSLIEKRRCGDLPVRIIDLELTFSAQRFSTLFGLLQPASCRSFVQWSFVTLDLLFPIAYGLGLCALFLWAERQRRFERDGSASKRLLPFRNHVFVLVPLVAALIDLVFENVPLWLAATMLGNGWSADSLFIAALVCVGSLAAALKWTLVLLSVLAIFSELLSLSRGRVLRRLRYSIIAVVLGALPLLLIPQGQDILQRVVEGDEPWSRIAGALVALVFAARTVWYCGRKLVQLVFPDDPDPQDEWYLFFAEHNPRMLGIAILVLGGAAFARAGGAFDLFAGAALGGFIVAHFAIRHSPLLSDLLWRPFRRTFWATVADLDKKVSRTIVASVIGYVIILPPWGNAIPRDFYLLRVAAWLLLVLAWVFFLYVYTRRARIIGRNKTAEDPNEPFRVPRPDGSFSPPFFPRRAKLLRVEPEAVASIDQHKLIRTIKRDLLLGVIASTIAVIAFTVWPVESARGLGALVILALVASSVVFYGSLAAWVHGKYRIPVVPVLVVFAALFSVWNGNHVVRKLEGGRDLVIARSDIATHLSNWRPTDTSSASSPVILVAAAGGGLRAAYWTATSLAAIQHRNHAFNRHVFAISGVSGGSLGAAVYAAVVRDVERDSSMTCRVSRTTKDTSTFGPYHDCVRSFMAEDFLSPVLVKMVAPDFLQLLLPVPIKAFDRSLALEGSWEKSYYDMTKRRTMSEGFLALAPDTASGGSVPALFLNATHVETGKRYVTTPLVRGDSTPPPGSSKRNMHDAGDLLDILQSDLPLSTAVHNSARFSYVSPPARIQRSDSTEYGHLVDGGYFENSGLATLREILDVVRSVRSAAGARPLLPVVIYLCNDPVGCRDSGAGDTLITARRAAIVEWAGPIRALLGTRDARGSLARADIADIDSVEFIQLNVCESLIADEASGRDTASLLGSNERRQRARERIVSPPLGWLLSKVARDWMDASLTRSDSTSIPSRCRESNERAIQRIDALLRLH